MPLAPPCFVPDFFFDNEVLSIVRGVMDDKVVADQWGCDVPIRGSDYQGVHVDYQRPLFSEAPDLSVPAYVLVVSFGLVRITLENGLSKLRLAHTVCQGRRRFEPWKPAKLACSQSRWRSVMY